MPPSSSYQPQHSTAVLKRYLTTAAATTQPSSSSQPVASPSPVVTPTSSSVQPPRHVTVERHTELSHSDYLRMILTAKVYDVAIESPLQLAQSLSARTGHSIYLKREDLQPVFSFKLRGAYNKIASLSAEQRQAGILTCSAGNHAQGVALAASKLHIRSTILMPVHTPAIKVNAVRRLGAEVILHGSDFDEAAAECRRLSAASGRVIVHPYDDPHVIAGQGTIAMEIVRQWTAEQPIDTVFVCVGGGGLIAGISTYIKALFPATRIVGVEADDAAAMTQSLAAGRRIELKEVGLFADGAAVRLVGEETFRLCRQFVDEMVTVSNDEICAAIKDTFEDTRSVLEPAGALALAGCKRWISQHGKAAAGRRHVCITSGANMNFNRLRFVAERAELGEEREALLAVTIDERPGEFMRLYEGLGGRNVTEFSYRYSDPHKAHIYLSFEVKQRSEIEAVTAELLSRGMHPVDISHNDMAKDHTRHLAGGRSPLIRNERIFRFVFPERPAALLRFLQCLNSGGNSNGSSSNGNSGSSGGSGSGGSERWNISLFHYRNYGSDSGKVLCGIQVSDGQREAFDRFLQRLGYPYVEETNNPVYKQFLL